MNLLLSSALLSAVVWSSWALPDPEQRQARQYMVPYTSQHHIVPYASNPFFRYQPTAPLTPYAYAYGTHGLPYLSASPGYRPIREGFEYDNVDDKGRFLGSFTGADLAKVGTATELKGQVSFTQSIFIPNNQAVATILLDDGFMNNAVYVVTIRDDGDEEDDLNGGNNPPLPTDQNHKIDNEGEVLGAYKVSSGIFPVVKLTAASRFYNIDGNGMSVAGRYIQTPSDFEQGNGNAVPDDQNNPTIAAQNLIKLSGKQVCVYEFTDTSCNMPLETNCAVNKAGCGKIG